MIRWKNFGSYFHNRSSLVKHELGLLNFICPSCGSTYIVSNLRGIQLFLASHFEVLCKKPVQKKLCSLIKKRLENRCFTVNFAKFLSTLIIEHRITITLFNRTPTIVVRSASSQHKLNCHFRSSAFYITVVMKLYMEPLLLHLPKSW